MNFKLNNKLVTVLCILTFCSACGTRTDTPTTPAPIAKTNLLLDLQNYPQDLSFYANLLPNETLISYEEQDKELQRYKRLFFAPWTITKASIKSENILPTFKQNGYAENLRLWTQENKAQLLSNANMSAFPSLFIPAITIRSTSLRELPTTKPRFSDPALAGQGYPFDLTQYSSLPIAMPLRIIHQSLDKVWVYVETALVSGWIESKDIAELSQDQVYNYMQLQLVAVTNDNLSLLDSRSKSYLATAHIGSILPIDPKNTQNILVPTRDAQAKAVFNSAQSYKNPQDSSTMANTTPLPLTMTAQNIALIGNQLLNQIYGWGGLYENRDCSTMLRDLMTPFAVWLPRNSSAQAKNWHYTDFSKQTNPEKLKNISQNAPAFRTLLWLPGHIALYLGTYNNTPIIFHNIWGLRTIETNQSEGRFIIGQAIISSTELGKELKNIKPNSSLINRIQGMSILE